MNILNHLLFKNKGKKQHVKKSNDFGDTFGVTLTQALSPANGAYNAYTAMWVYSQCAPIYTAIDLITSHYVHIPPRLYDTKSEEFLPNNNNIIDLLESPNSCQGYHALITDLVTNYLVTGNAFLMVTYGARGKPIEMYSLSPIYMQAVGIVPDQPIPSLAKEYLYSGFGYAKTFKYEEDGCYLSSEGYSRLFHIKDFVNNAAYYQSHFGLSKIHIIFREAQLYSEGNLNNLSNIKRGMNGNTVLYNTDPNSEPLTEDQFSAMRNQIAEKSGSQNSGKTMILPVGFDIKSLGNNNRDMQYYEQHKTMIAAIARIYRIPLPLISEDSMTYSNFDTAKALLIRNAVLPLSHIINETLTSALLDNTNQEAGTVITINESDIPELRKEEVDISISKRSTGAVTINELRETMGYAPIEGGDVLPNQGAYDSVSNDDELSDLSIEEVKFIKSLDSGKFK